MKPKQLRVPAPVHHRPSGRDVVFVRDAEGKRRRVYLGEHGSTEAARRYREVLSERLAGKPVTTAASAGREPTSEWPTVAQLCAAFLLDAERYYDGAASSPPHRHRRRHSRRTASRSVIAAFAFPLLFHALGHHLRTQSRRRCQHPVIGHQMFARLWHQRAQSLHQHFLCHHHVGRAVLPPLLQ
ncbi:MAG: hypothetical protein NT107_01385 [Planctomycetota bacterium]|nr:hypothetical protein [Planctomycetota bacterium]